jgi:hypothetical protein
VGKKSQEWKRYANVAVTMRAVEAVKERDGGVEGGYIEQDEA